MHVLGPGSPCLAWPGVVAAPGPSRAGASGLPRGRGAGRRWVARVSQGRAGSLPVIWHSAKTLINVLSAIVKTLIKVFKNN